MLSLSLMNDTEAHTFDHQYMDPGGQISPSGVLLQNISPDGIFLKKFPQGGTFLRGCMHGASKPPVGLAGLLLLPGVATDSSDLHMHRNKSPLPLAI